MNLAYLQLPEFFREKTCRGFERSNEMALISETAPVRDFSQRDVHLLDQAKGFRYLHLTHVLT
jgi:hypothetical protein